MVAVPLFAVVMFTALMVIDLAWTGDDLGDAVAGNLVQVAVTTVLWVLFMWLVAWRENAPLHRAGRGSR